MISINHLNSLGTQLLQTHKVTITHNRIQAFSFPHGCGCGLTILKWFPHVIMYIVLHAMVTLSARVILSLCSSGDLIVRLPVVLLNSSPDHNRKLLKADWSYRAKSLLRKVPHRASFSVNTIWSLCWSTVFFFNEPSVFVRKCYSSWQVSTSKVVIKIDS